jgi:hypothetical protein
MNTANHGMGKRTGAPTARGNPIEQEFPGTNKLLLGLAWMLAGKAIRKAKGAPAPR